MEGKYHPAANVICSRDKEIGVLTSVLSPITDGGQIPINVDTVILTSYNFSATKVRIFRMSG